MPKTKAINLLPQEEFNTSTTGRVLKWATSSFRVIVIITEMIVMGAFLSRFWLDAQNSNLNESIKIKSAQISAQANIERQFRDVQSKLDIFAELLKNHETSKLMAKVTSSVPENVTLSRVTMDSDSIEIRGSSMLGGSIAQFVANLKDKQFTSVELGQISSSANNPLETIFAINITTK